MEFSGYYDVSGVREQGELVQVTLHLRLFNHDDADARNVIVTLMESGPAQNLWGNFQPVKVWKHQQFIEMSQKFSVPRRDYAEWSSAAGRPNVVILYQDGKGKSWQNSPLISRRPMAPAAE
jgi:hypothetical protein